ncbi:retrovirus-related Pol polyprotein from transposon 412 [Trichonephila clavipes]|nr:retrovirus-related Pol polyprotein from transposon 412 [Trichonephila clavipes]
MPTEQSQARCSNTSSLQQWRSPSTFRGAPGKTLSKWLKEYDRVANFAQKRSFKTKLNGFFAPVSTKPTETRPLPTYAAVTRKYRAPVQKFPTEPRKTDVWRTADNRPVCFSTAGRLDISPSPYRRSSPSPGRRARKTKESDLPRRSKSQAVIDCGQNELVLEDICRDSTAPDAWNLYATRDYTLKPHSLTRITVSGYQTRRHKCSSRRQQTFALREKYRYTVHGIHIWFLLSHAEPLQSLLKSGVEFHWGPEEVKAFNSLKKALTSDPVLGMYDERASTEIHTDASGYGIGAALVQIQNNV